MHQHLQKTGPRKPARADTERMISRASLTASTSSLPSPPAPDEPPPAQSPPAAQAQTGAPASPDAEPSTHLSTSPHPDTTTDQDRSHAAPSPQRPHALDPLPFPLRATPASTPPAPTPS